MNTLKFEYVDGTRKCYTNVVDLQLLDNILTFSMEMEGSTIHKLIPYHIIKHLQIETQET